MMTSSLKATARSCVEAEACGEPFIVVEYKQHEFKLPTDADEWPLDIIAISVGMLNDKLVVDHTTVALALNRLLRDQWRSFVSAFPLRRDLVPASRVFAHAAGFDASRNDIAFGALPRLLATINAHADAVEATLADCGVDYRDRFRFDADQRRLLTLRQIHVRLKFAPFNNALMIAQNNNRLRLSGTEILLMDLYEAMTRRVHPSRPMTAEQKAARATSEEKLEDERAKYRDRHAKPTPQRKQQAIETARQNAPSKGRARE